MKTVTKLATAVALSTTMSVSAFAETKTPVKADVQVAINHADLSYAFGSSNQDLQVMTMNGQQMQDTEGAWVSRFVRNIRIDGPSKGVWHGNGRVFQIRYGNTVKTRTPVFRLDYHPNPSPTKLHMHVAPNMKVHRPWYTPWRGF